MSVSPTRHRIALGIALVGIAVSAVTVVVHERIASDAAYTSFCNLGGAINCDIVLGSRFGEMWGIPVAAFGLATFVTGALLALPGALGARVALADLALLGLASASMGFAVVLAGIMALVLHHACLLCLGTDVVIFAWFLTVLPLASRFESSARSGWWRRRGAAYATVAGAAVLAVAGGTLAAVRSPAPATNVAEIRARDPQFYSWYMALPVRPASDVAGRTEHMKGPTDAPITIVEFSDFQCPHCAEAYPVLRRLIHGRPDVRLIFRHFPLDPACNNMMPAPGHPDACLAAEAAECAGRQQRFWEYHDTLFEHHETLDRDSLFRYARELGLDIPTFRTCLDDPETRARVVDDVDAGNRAGIMQTPTLFINGRTVAGTLQPAYYEYALIIEKEERDTRASRGGS